MKVRLRRADLLNTPKAAYAMVGGCSRGSRDGPASEH